MPQKGTEKKALLGNVISTDTSALFVIYCRDIAPFETPIFSKNVGELIARATSVPQKRTGPRVAAATSGSKRDPRHWRAHPAIGELQGQVSFDSVASHIASNNPPLACRGQRDIHMACGMCWPHTVRSSKRPAVSRAAGSAYSARIIPRTGKRSCGSGQLEYQLLGAVALAASATAQTTPAPSAITRTVSPPPNCRTVTDVPLHFRAVSVTLTPGEKSGALAANGILYQLSGST